jgi:hypothetical protein
LNQIADILTRALDSLRTDGWIQEALQNDNGQRCAQGAVIHVLTGLTGKWALHPAALEHPDFPVAMCALYAALHDASPAHWMLAASEVARYNNTHDFADVENMFIKAIALTAAANIQVEAEEVLASAPALITV